MIDFSGVDIEEVLLDQMAKLASTLSKVPEKDRDNDKYKFHKKTLDVMHLAWSWITDIKHIRDHNNSLQLENKFLREYAGTLKKKLGTYEAIKEEIVKEKLDIAIETAQRMFSIEDMVKVAERNASLEKKASDVIAKAKSAGLSYDEAAKIIEQKENRGN